MATPYVSNRFKSKSEVPSGKVVTRTCIRHVKTLRYTETSSVAFDFFPREGTSLLDLNRFETELFLGPHFFKLESLSPRLFLFLAFKNVSLPPNNALIVLGIAVWASVDEAQEAKLFRRPRRWNSTFPRH